jgi:ABC-type oligopeptide transport system substrate-binding subunit
MKVTIANASLAGIIEDYTSHDWQVMIGNTGSADPALGIGGVATFFTSTGRFSEVADPTLDTMIHNAATLDSASARLAAYKQIDKMLSQQAYAIFTVSQPEALVVGRNVTGDNVTVGPEGPQVPWADLALK